MIEQEPNKKKIGLPSMNDLDAGFHGGLRPVVRDRTRDAAEPETPFFATAPIREAKSDPIRQKKTQTYE